MYKSEDIRRIFKDRAPGIQGAKGRFAVLVPMVDIDGEANLLFELRSSHIDRQPGEVCFPGGEIEDGESPLDAAVRETREETGIPAENIDIVAELDTLHPPSNIVIYPFLAEIRKEALKDMKLSECEVAEVFLVPVSFFLEQEPYVYEHSMKMDLGDDFQYDRIGLENENYPWRPMKHSIISWKYDGKYIWGLTAMIVRWTLDIFKKGQ